MCLQITNDTQLTCAYPPALSHCVFLLFKAGKKRTNKKMFAPRRYVAIVRSQGFQAPRGKLNVSLLPFQTAPGQETLVTPRGWLHQAQHQFCLHAGIVRIAFQPHLIAYCLSAATPCEYRARRLLYIVCQLRPVFQIGHQLFDVGAGNGVRL
jgi:hypothetical protein